MAGNKSDILASDPVEAPQTGISRAIAGPGIFHRAGPVGLPVLLGDPHPLAPAGRHQLAAPPAPEDAPDVALQFGPHAMHPILSAYTLRVLTGILRAAVQPHALISSTARTLADEARVAYLYLKKQDFSGPKRRDALKDPLAAVFILAVEGKESPADIIDGLEDKLAELGTAYAGKFRPTDTLLDYVNIEPDSLDSPDDFAKSVARDTRVINFLAPPACPHFHLEIPQPRAAGTTKDGAGSGPEAPPPPPKPKSKTWIEFRIVEDGTGKPVGGVRLRVTKPDGVEDFFTADSAGVVRIEDLDPGKCDIGEMIDADALEVVSVQ